MKMINDKNQKQEGGDDSTNLQAQSITIHGGISYRDARDIALDIYKANYLQLSQDAAALASERAMKITDDFLGKLKEQNEAALESMKEPSMQMAIFNAQKAYATTGDDELEKVLVNILLERASQDKRTLKQITLDESLIVAPKLTFEQMDALTINFLISRTKNAKLVNLEALKSYLFDNILPFVESLRSDSSAFNHLEYAGCGSIMESGHILPIEQIFRDQYKGLFSKGGSAEEYKELLVEPRACGLLVTRCLRFPNLLQISAIDESTIDDICKNSSISQELQAKAQQLFETHTMSQQEVKEELLNLCPGLEKLFEMWEKTEISKFTLTTVGFAIARANLKRLTNIDTDLGIWVK